MLREADEMLLRVRPIMRCCVRPGEMLLLVVCRASETRTPGTRDSGGGRQQTLAPYKASARFLHSSLLEIQRAVRVGRQSRAVVRENEAQGQAAGGLRAAQGRAKKTAVQQRRLRARARRTLRGWTWSWAGSRRTSCLRGRHERGKGRG